ncbi:MAG: dihydroorotate dehydrogenase [Clostridiales bacterium]|nr:dihydroorotate dehydrogenase [Clostridiales bacterium]
MSERLKVKLNGIELCNPVTLASGCCGNAVELDPHTDLSALGGVTLKTVTREPRKGNPPPRILDVHGGMMSSIGLMNVGIDQYLEKVLPAAAGVLRPGQRIVSVGGSVVDDYIYAINAIAEKYGKDEIAALELNACCPNVKAGGAAFSSNPGMVAELTKAVCRISPYPVIVKIIANFPNMNEVAKAVEAEGADAIHMSISPMGIAIDIKKKKPYFYNVKAPLSGPLVKPIGILKTWDLYEEISLPMIASGGIACADDAVEYMMAGLSAVAIGAMNYINPKVGEEVVLGLEKYCEENAISNISEIVGIAHVR